MSARRTSVLLVSGAVILFVLLFIAPKIAPKLPEAEIARKPFNEGSISASLDVYLNLAMKNIAPERKKVLDAYILSKRLDSVVIFWDKVKRPDLASFYVEEVAKRDNNPKAWVNAGNRYYYSVQFIEDKTEVPILYQSAMRCFAKCLSLDPKNTEAKIMLASCYVEGSGDPMEGIKRLREIEKTDSNNVKLQLTFAFFSVKSGQWDRAIARFNKVLQVDSAYIEAYLHLADAYEQLGETEKTIIVLEKYSAKTDDVTAKIEIKKYIQQLKSNINH